MPINLVSRVSLLGLLKLVFSEKQPRIFINSDTTLCL